MTQCRNCGTELPEHVKYCPRCGTPVELVPWTAPADTEAADKRGGRAKIVLLVLGGAVLLCAVAAVLVLFVFQPRQLAGGELQALLPEGAEVLESVTERIGRTQIVTYQYEQDRTYCDSVMTEELTLRYADGRWNMDAAPKVLRAEDDWTGLEGTWEMHTDDPCAADITVEVGSVLDGGVTGSIQYAEGSTSYNGELDGCFVMDAEAYGNAILLRGTGFFADTCLRIDRDEGMFFNNDVFPMTRSSDPPA